MTRTAAPEIALPNAHRPATPTWLSWLLIASGAAGLTASLALAIERIHSLQAPDAVVGCDLSIWIQCSGAMSSWQGSLLGFPNPLLGLMGFVAPIAVGVATLAGARFARWFWIAFTIGVTLALCFVLWLASQTLFVLGLVCPWCFLAWMAMYAMFWPLVTVLIADGHVPMPASIRRTAQRFRSWGWVLSLAMAVAVIVLIMIQLPEIPRELLGG